MTFLHLLPALLSLLILCAHLFRSAGLVLALPVLVLMTLLLVPKGWVARFFQMFLVFESFEWVRTAVSLAQERSARGEPWVRMVVILGVVTLFTLFSAAMFESETLLKAYPRRSLE
jgi:hypothetical protein